VLLALSEIRRGKLRFGLLTGAVGLLVFLILFLQTLTGALLGFFTGALEHQSAQILVYGEDARRNPESSRVTVETVDAVAQVDGVATAAAFSENTLSVDAGGADLFDTTIFGYELDGPGEPTTLSQGRLPRADGEAVASAIDAGSGFGLGDVVTVVPGKQELTIVGLADDLRFSVQPTLFVSYETFERTVLATNPDAQAVLPSMVAVRVDAGVETAAVANEITDRVEGVDAVTREGAVSSLPGVSAVRSSFQVLLFLAGFVVLLVTGIFFSILTVQKTQALTLLRAVGASAGYLLRNLLLQVLLVTLGGIGVAAGLLALAASVSTPDFPIDADPGLILATGSATLVLALAASIASIRRVRRLDPAGATTRMAGGGLA